MKKFYPAVLCLSLLATSVSNGFCDTTPSNDNDEVVVSASRFEEKKKDVTANITTITREDIEQSPANNLGDLLAEKGFGHIQKYPGSLVSIGIRGFRTDTHGNDLQGKVLILLDGRRAATGNAVKILKNNIEKVEIIRGPGAVQYGSAGMGGVVNVISKKGKENSVFVEAGAGSFGYYEGAVGATAKMEGFDFSGTLSTQSSDDYDTGDGETFHNTGIEQETGVSLNAGYTFQENHRFGVIFNHYEVDESGSPNYISANDLDDYSDKSNTSIDASYTGSSSDDKYKWMARFFVGEDENTWHDPVASNPDFWDNGIPSFNKTEQQGAQIQASGNFGLVTLTGGFDWVDYEIENSYSPTETTYSNPAIFLLGKVQLLDEKLTTTFGLRQDWFTVEVVEPRGREEDQDNLTPQIGLAYQVCESVKFRAQYAEGFMLPSAQQLASDTVSWGRHTVGNPDLDPESSQTYEGGVDVQAAAFKGSFTYFHTSFEDKIVTTYLSDGSQTWENLGEATISGVEAELSYDIGQSLDIAWEIRPYLNLTYLTEFEDDETGEDLQYTSDTNLSAGVASNNYEGLNIRFNVTYYSSQEIEDWESGTYPAPVGELDDITVADLTVSYLITESERVGKVSVRGEITNIFDEDYSYVKGYPQPGRSFFLGLRWEY